MLQHRFFWKKDFLWTLEWGEKSVPKTSPLSTVLPSARTCGCQDKEPAHKHSTQHVIFSGVMLRKTWAMWTLKWGAKSGPRFGVRRIVFSFRGPQNGVQILGPILRSTLPVFFSQPDAEKGHPRVGCLWAGSFPSHHIAGTGEDLA